MSKQLDISTLTYWFSETFGSYIEVWRSERDDTFCFKITGESKDLAAPGYRGACESTLAEQAVDAAFERRTA